MDNTWVHVTQDSHFPLQNLPYGVFSTPEEPRHRIGVAIGDYVLDLSSIAHLFTGPLMSGHQDSLRASSLNSLMSLSHAHWAETRSTLQTLLSRDTPTLRQGH